MRFESRGSWPLNPLDAFVSITPRSWALSKAPRANPIPDRTSAAEGGRHRTLTIQLVVTDHLMPGMSGTDLAYEVRERRPDLGVLILSGYADVEGVAPHLPRLTKPFRKDELAASLAGLFPSALDQELG